MIKPWPLLLLYLLTTLLCTVRSNLNEKLEDKLEARNINSENRPYSNLRIFFDFTGLKEVPRELADYITSLLSPAKDFFEKALKVKSLGTNLRYNGKEICGGTVTTPETYKDGTSIDADLVIFVTQTNQVVDNGLVAGSICEHSDIDSRPLFGKISFNINRLSPTNDIVKAKNDTILVMHEITRVLGFCSGVYHKYIDPDTGNALIGHVFNKTIHGIQVIVLNVEPLTTRLRSYFNCSSLEGAYMENQYIERTFLMNNEYLPVESLRDYGVSEFILALLQGTGWYKADFSMAEPVIYGKNKGCSFIDTIIASQTPYIGSKIDNACDLGCSGRGTCNSNRHCQCVDGWESEDCSKMTYMDNCARCIGKDPLKTSCYGDSCECNPSNTTCGCRLGLLNGLWCSSALTFNHTNIRNLGSNSTSNSTSSSYFVVRDSMLLIIITIVFIVVVGCCCISVFFIIKHRLNKKQIRGGRVYNMSTQTMNTISMDSSRMMTVNTNYQ